MTGLEKLITKRAAHVADMKAFCDAPENSDWGAEQDRRYNPMKGALAGMDAEITFEEARREAERTAPALSIVSDGDDNGRSRLPRRAAGKIGGLWADMWGAVRPSRDIWPGGFEEFASALHSGFAHPGLQAVVTGPGGVGYMVPEQFASMIFDHMLEDEIVRPRAVVHPMESDTKKIAGFVHNDASATPPQIFGVAADWVEEADTINESTPVVKSLTLNARKLAGLVQVSNEAIEDGTSVGGQLETALTKAGSWHLDNAFLTGSGAGQPLGVLSSPALITIARETALEISYVDVTTMFSRLHPASVKNAVWVAHTSTIPQLMTLVVMAGATPTPVSHVAVQRAADGSLELLTRPLLFTEKVSALGTEGDLSLMDFTQYAIGLRRGMAVDRSAHLGFAKHTTYFRSIIRADGFPIWPAPYTPKSGATLSPFVTLTDAS